MKNTLTLDLSIKTNIKDSLMKFISDKIKVFIYKLKLSVYSLLYY